jgi:hypothetical protein
MTDAPLHHCDCDPHGDNAKCDRPCCRPRHAAPRQPAPPTALGPRAQAALNTAIRAAFDAGVAQGRQGRGLNLRQVQDYAQHQVQTAMILDAAETEAAAQDPH